MYNSSGRFGYLLLVNVFFAVLICSRSFALERGLEQTRLRCMSRMCHLRSDEEKALLVASPVAGGGFKMFVYQNPLIALFW